MRVKVVIPLLLLGVIAILLPLVMRHSARSSPPAQAAAVDLTPKIKADSTEAAGHTGDVPTAAPAAAGNQAGAENQAPDVETGDTTNAEYEVYVVNRTAELEHLGMMNDSGSLAQIESELDNRDPRIQEAAVAAAVQFGSRDAIPALEASYNHFDDPEQKINIQKAIDFLKLPSMSEMNSATASTGGNNGN